jgi:serine/threonine protein phosphatase 1
VWNWLVSRKETPPAKVPDGIRIYAIGDVHGRIDLLDKVFETIDADLKGHPAARPIEIMLGDYVDRGPASREVLDRLITRSAEREMVCLKGNHETFVEEFLKDPTTLDYWRQYGGLETLMSYGLSAPTRGGAEEQARLSAEFAAVLPQAHRQFLAGLPLSYTCGDFFFAHAGVRPRVPLEEQREEDLLWIRDEFLACNEPFGKIVVHGHTPVVHPDVRPNRIGIDTGAYATGRLTCLRLEREDRQFL